MWMPNSSVLARHVSHIVFAVCARACGVSISFRMPCTATHYCRNHRIPEVKRHEQQPFKQAKKKKSKKKPEENNRIYVISFHSQRASTVFFLLSLSSYFHSPALVRLLQCFSFVLWHTVGGSMCAKSIDLSRISLQFSLRSMLLYPFYSYYAKHVFQFMSAVSSHVFQPFFFSHRHTHTHNRNFSASSTKLAKQCQWSFSSISQNVGKRKTSLCSHFGKAHSVACVILLGCITDDDSTLHCCVGERCSNCETVLVANWFSHCDATNYTTRKTERQANGS